MLLKPMEGGLWIKQSDTVHRESKRDNESTNLGVSGLISCMSQPFASVIDTQEKQVKGESLI